MKKYIGAYGKGAKRVKCNKIVNNHDYKSNFIDKYLQETGDSIIIDEIINIRETILSVELINSLFEDFEEFILVGQHKTICMNFKENSDDKKSYKLDLARFTEALEISDRVKFIETDAIINSSKNGIKPVEIDVSDYTIDFYNRYIKEEDSEKIDFYVLSASNGIRIVTEMIEQAVKLRKLLTQNCDYKIRYAFFDQNKNTLMWTNIDEENKQLELIDQLKTFLNHYSKIDFLNNERANDLFTENKKFYELLNKFYYALQTANIYEVEIITDEIISKYSLVIDSESNEVIKLVNNEIVSRFKKFKTNNDLFNYRVFIESLIDTEHYQLAITMCEGYLRNEICKLVEIQELKNINYSVEEEVLSWIKYYNRNMLKNFILNYDNYNKYTEKDVERNKKKFGQKGEYILKKTRQKIYFNDLSVQKKITKQAASNLENKLRTPKEEVKNFKQHYTEFKHFRNNLNHGTTSQSHKKEKFLQTLEHGFKCIDAIRSLNDN